MNARDLMTRIERMPADTNVWEARRQMAARRAAHVVIVDEREEVLGIVSTRDFRRLLDRADADDRIRGLRNATVGEIMTFRNQLVVVTPQTPVTELAKLIVEKRVGVLPVVADNRCLGAVKSLDVMRALMPAEA